MQAFFWMKIVTMAGLFGAVLGLAPYFVAGVLMGDLKTLESEEINAIAVLFIFPSVLIWLMIVRGLVGRDLATAVVCGIAWPCVTVLIAVKLNSTFDFNLELFSHSAFMFWVLALPLGGIAGLVIYRMVNTTRGGTELR